MLPGSVVYMTGFVDLNEIYIRKLEDYNDEYHTFLDKVNEFCQSGKYQYQIIDANLKIIVNHLF